MRINDQINLGLIDTGAQVLIVSASFDSGCGCCERVGKVGCKLAIYIMLVL